MDYFKNYLFIEPAMTTGYSVIIWMPWILKFLCGLMTDTIDLCGYRKTGWLFIMGFA
jgi:hypothetical protein